MPTHPWADGGPSNEYLIEVLFTLVVVALTAVTIFMSSKDQTGLLENLCVKAGKVQRALQEIERKAFHLCGLLVPITHQLLLWFGMTNRFCCQLCWAITNTGTLCDVARLHSPSIANVWPGRKLLRDHEKKQLTGGCFFSLGCTLAICISPPSIAMASILFLVLGDMSAALIGVSFGGDLSSIKLGRQGKKSVEGSVAMFLVCFCIGCTIFASVELREYACFLGALVATLIELYEPLGINDNLTIPVFASLALQLGFGRIHHCSNVSSLRWLKDAVVALV
mmetsp:Transcript_65370/g.129393  ORF Transcript_65370/g.129393 Transcript_65370/m.129393 type:complete len:280 (-) Transcript_65370:283-1122(-)